MSDIRDVLQNRTTHLAQSLRGADEFNLPAAKGAVRRKRTVRGVLVGSAATVAVLAIGAGAWAGYGAWRVGPATSQSPSATPSGSEKPSASPSPSVTPSDEHQIVSGADVEILERLEHPTTGETWHEPVEIASLGVNNTEGWPDEMRYFEIGTRGDATIVAVVPSSYGPYAQGYGINQLLEVEGDEVRWIRCPSSRASDPCTDFEPSNAGSFSVDSDTHYDSLTYPQTTSPVSGWNLGTAPGAEVQFPEYALLGTANGFPGIDLGDYEDDMTTGATRRELAKLGASTLVEYDSAGPIPGTVSSRFAIETPFGSVIWLGGWSGNMYEPSTVNGVWYAPDSVTWDDGKDTFTKSAAGSSSFDKPRPLPAALSCNAPDEVTLDAFDPADWVKAGTHAEGADVYLPVDGGNAQAKAVWTWLHDNSGADQINPDLKYPYSTYKEFLADRSVFAWQRPDGAWVLAINSYAAQRVYECA
ncbi:MAG: hypothetical protein NVV57_03065 [Demequina sp.]|nr:hypothetical protein [Demequina sp.]